MLIQFVSLRLANGAGRGYLTEAVQEKVYLFIQVAAILGFLAHALIRCKERDRTVSCPLTAVSAALCLAGTSIMLFCSPASLFYLVVTGISVTLVGFLGGSVYERLSMYMSSVRFAGLFIGIGYAAAVLLQFCLQLQWSLTPLLAFFMFVSFAVLAILLLNEDRLPAADADKNKMPSSRSAIALSIGITFALLIFTSYYNSYIHHLQIATGYTDYNVYSWPRLLMIPTVILFGSLGDIKGGRLLPICTLCISVTALLNTALLGSDTYILNMCLYYVALTAVVAYYHVTFLHLAGNGRHRALTACTGRIIDSVVVIVSFGLNISTQSQFTVLLINVLALATAIIMMAFRGALNLSVQSVPVSKEDSAADPFPVIGEKYGITPSELKVLRELVTTDDKQVAIASRMNISVSTLRHHITSIYRKTGVQTRSALCKLLNAAK